MGKLKKYTQSYSLACTGEWSANYQPVPVTGTSTVTVVWNEQVQFGDNIPGWKDRIADGRNVTTTMVGGRGLVRDRSDGYWTQTTSSGDANYRTSGSGKLLNRYLVSPASLAGPPASLIEQASSLAEIDFAKKFSSGTSQFQTGVFAGELLQTARMLASPAKHLRGSIDTLYTDLKRIVRSNSARGGAASARALKDAIAGTYLEWKFGVTPLISDVDDAARAFRALASGRTFDTVRFTGRGEADSSTETSDIFTPGTPGFLAHTNWRVEKILYHHVDCTLRGAWKCDRPDGQMPVPMIFSLGLKDIIPTAWELVPWSFFVDYFTNIGDVLGAWSMRFVDFAWLNMTTRTLTRLKVLPPPGYFRVEAFPGFPRTSILNCPGELRIDWRTINRSSYVNRWSPTPLVKIPGMSGRGATQWLNTAALLAMKNPPAAAR